MTDPFVDLGAAIIEQAISDLKVVASGKKRPRGTKWAFTREHFYEFFRDYCPALISLTGIRLDPDAVSSRLQPLIQKVPV